MERNGHHTLVLSALTMSGFLMASLALSSLPVLAPGLGESFGLSASQIGMLMSIFLLAYGLMQIPAGSLASRFGGRVLIAACGILAAGSFIMSVGSSLSVFALGRLVQGLGAGMVLPAAGAVFAAFIPANSLRRAWGIFGMGWGLGSILALTVLPSILRVWGFRAAPTVLALLSLGIGALCAARGELRTAPDRAAAIDGGGGPASRLRPLLANRDLNLLGLINAAALAGGVGALAWTPSYLDQVYLIGTESAAYLTAALGAAQIIATPAGAFLADRLGPIKVILGSFAALAVLLAAIPLLPNVGSAGLALLLVGFFSMAYFSPTFALVPKVTAAHMVGTANGYVNAQGFLGSLIAPWLFGTLLDSGRGYLGGYLLLAAFAVAGLAGVRLLAVGRTAHL